ncbi:MAG TPA: delta-60 repeat domain-containing protein [Ideonella sp.]|nr:delta-60 repeat domain-containing protein [Ideonella sp.]
MAAALTLLCGVSGLTAHAADGDLDPAFGRAGQMMTDFDHSTDIAYAVALQADGKIVAAGTTYKNNDYSDEDFAIARYNANGRLDATFGVNGRVTTDFPGLAAVVSAMVVQPDGKILVAGGAFPLFTFLGDFKLARYNPNGSLDTSFGSGGIVTTRFGDHGSYAFSLALQPDGKIVAAGTAFVDFSFGDASDTDFALARYNTDGTPDTTFGSGGQITTDFDGFSDDAFSVLIQPDGKIVAVGSAMNPANYYDFALARYLANGTLDARFGRAGRVVTDFGDHNFDRARSAVLQPDGKIVAAGFAISQNGVAWTFAVARYGSNGALDPAFRGDGKRKIDFGSCCQSATRVLLQADGRLIVVGYPDSESTDSDFVLARLHPNGLLDASFGSGGKVRTSFGDLNGGASGAALQPDGKIVAVGFQATNTSKWAQFALARYLGNSGGLSLTPAASRAANR